MSAIHNLSIRRGQSQLDNIADIRILKYNDRMCAMLPADSVDVFQRKYLPPNGKDAIPIRTLLQSVFSFYRHENAAGLTETEGDMLLFQFGGYDWGSGQSFQVGLTRQFIELENGSDEYVLSQFQLTCHYSVDEQLLAFGRENRWCSHISQLDEFATWVERHQVLNAVETFPRKKTELCWDLV